MTGEREAELRSVVGWPMASSSVAEVWVLVDMLRARIAELEQSLAKVQRAALQMDSAQGVELAHLRKKSTAAALAIAEREGLLSRDAVMTERIAELEAEVERVWKLDGEHQEKAFANHAALHAHVRELRGKLFDAERDFDVTAGQTTDALAREACEHYRDKCAVALARPVDDSALREMLLDCVSECAQTMRSRCSCSHCDESAPGWSGREIVSRLLGGGK
jgi:hypothetical protein